MKTKGKSNVFISICGLVTIVVMLGMASTAQIYAQSGATIYLDSTRQVIRGFGAANIVGWRPDMTAGQIQTAFGSGPNQLGFSIMRLRIPPDSTQFSVNFASAQAAASMGVTLIATPWTPPAWMKTNNNTVGGSLDTNNYAAYAAYLKSFADTMANNGAPLYAISVQNEPDANVTYESCYWSGTQFMNFMKYNAPSVGIPVFMPESMNFNHAFSDATLNDSAACAHTAFVGGHLYGTSPTSYALAASKGKETWMTEWLNTDTSWAANLATGKQINDCMNVGMSAYVWWYIVRFYGPINENSNSPTKRGYVMSQFSRFVRPNDVCVFTGVPRGSVYVSAFKSVIPGTTSNSRYVIVALNMSTSPVDEDFTVQDIADGAATVVPFVTSASQNCEQQSVIALTNGAFTATLPQSSITTFVGNVVTAVEKTGAVPQTFELYQNYPNPFNPTTEIRYDIPERSFVRVVVYDLLGRAVSTLVNEVENAGHYRINFSATNLPSGVYFYQLQAAGKRVVRKMVLLK